MIYQFDDFKVNASSYDILQGNRLLEAQPQVIELLIYLIKNRMKCVDRDELFLNVWKSKVVSNNTLSSRIKSARKLLGDNGKQQKYIRTIHGRGFQFLADVTESDPGAPLTLATIKPGATTLPVTQYAKSGSVHIAYQVFGNGPVDLILVPGFISHIENYWESRWMATWLEALGQSARVVMFDKRGTGMSDPVHPLPDFDTRMDDVGAVMDAVGIDKAYVMGISEGGSLAALFAAVHPDRCLGLILYGAFANFTSWYKTHEELLGLFDYIESSWGSGESLSQFSPSVQNDPEFKEWWGKFERRGASPGAAISLMSMNSEIDISNILPGIKSPSLVIHRDQDVLIDVAAGRFLAKNIQGASYFEIEGSDHLPWTGENSAEITSTVGEFIHNNNSPVFSNTTLSTVLSIDLSAVNTGSQQLSEAILEATKLVTHYRGKILNPGTNYLYASFDGPARAVHCGCDIVHKSAILSLGVKACVQTGELEIIGDQATGHIINFAETILADCEQSSVLISDTVKSLISGSGINVALKTTTSESSSSGCILYNATT
ncbi:MAG: alpha/beta hydrolase [Gammaproteobacteria bacterium]|nr:alpha/beta hydrolase [Gammaproteobacteria bacterium]